MTTNRFYILDGDLVPWMLEGEPPSRWPDCRYFGQVLAAIDRARPSLGMQFILTKAFKGRLPLRGDDVVVICIGDEMSRMPAYAHDVRLVGKAYGVQRTPNVFPAGSVRSLPAVAATLTQEMIVQAQRSPSLFTSWLRTTRRGRRPLVIAVPLGTYLLEDVPFVAFEERSLDVSYAGSRVNRSKEARRRIPTQKMRSRQDLQDVLQGLLISRPELRIGIHVVETFHDVGAHGAVYSQMLMDTRLALCPRGGSLETYRFFEALRSGCVPVVEKLPDRDFYTGAPVVRVRRWGDLPLVLDRLLAQQDSLRANHEAAVRWWEERCSPAAVARSLLAALE